MTDSARLKKLAREYMAAHPGTRYQQALDAVRAHQTQPGTDAWLDFIAAADTSQLTARWAHNALEPNLRAPLGWATDEHLAPGPESQLVWADLGEARDRGHGPHAAVLGRTGSGKTELLRTWLTALAARYSPNRVQFIIAGASAARGLQELPHTAAVLCLKTDGPDAAVTLAAVLSAELDRREELITAAIPRLTTSKDIHGYRELSAGGQAEPLPDLVVVVDELVDYDDSDNHRHGVSLTDALVRTTRAGRTLGVHLILTARTFTREFRSLLENVSLRVSLGTNNRGDSEWFLNTSGRTRASVVDAGGGAPFGAAFMATAHTAAAPMLVCASSSARADALRALIATAPHSSYRVADPATA